MNTYHQELLSQIQSHAGKGTTHTAGDSYLSSGHEYYSIAVPLKRTIVKEWVRSHKDISVTEFVSLLDSLFAGKSYEEKTIAGLLLGYVPKLRKIIDPTKLDEWLEGLQGWAEIDTLCQSNFTAEELLSTWHVWEELLKRFVVSQHVAKKRASLVLLTGPVSHTDNKKLAQLAFENIAKLQTEKDILITKAISWLLRSLVKYHKEEVVHFMDENQQTLPKIALRETKNKLRTGKK